MTILIAESTGTKKDLFYGRRRRETSKAFLIFKVLEDLKDINETVLASKVRGRRVVGNEESTL